MLASLLLQIIAHLQPDLKFCLQAAFARQPVAEQTANLKVTVDKCNAYRTVGSFKACKSSIRAPVNLYATAG